MHAETVNENWPHDEAIVVMRGSAAVVVVIPTLVLLMWGACCVTPPFHSGLHWTAPTTAYTGCGCLTADIIISPVRALCYVM